MMANGEDLKIAIDDLSSCLAPCFAPRTPPEMISFEFLAEYPQLSGKDGMHLV
jgi:hypothetical protein